MGLGEEDNGGDVVEGRGDGMEMVDEVVMIEEERGDVMADPRWW